MSSKALAKRGPKSAEGKLAVRLNASTHGILSPQPVVNAYESLKDWESHRAAIVGSLCPEGGMEQLLAERVALCSWRLNRVVLYESEMISEAQEGVVESVREKRERRLKIERMFAKEGEKVLMDLGVLIEAHPENALDDVRMARKLYKTVRKVVVEGPPDTPIKGEDGAWVLGLAAEHAIRLAAHQRGEELEDEEVSLLAEALQERLPAIADDAFLGDVDYSVGQLHELIKWLAEEAGVQPDAHTWDGSTVSPQEQLLERIHREARYDLVEKESKAEEAQQQLLAAHRERILPGEEHLQKIARYESHLSRQMYQALHELEALQKRRSGGTAALARVDLQ